MTDYTRKHSAVKVENTKYATSLELHINYNNRYAAEILNYGIRYGI